MHNVACRIIYKLGKYEHVTRHLQQLHSVLYPERIGYNIALLMFKCKNNSILAYFSEKVYFDPNSNSDRQCRSCYKYTAMTLWYKTSQTQNASFSITGPKYGIPSHHLRSHCFKRKPRDLFLQKIIIFNIS